MPVGLLALTVGSIILCGSQLQWVPDGQTAALAWCLLAFVAPLQFTAFVFAVLAHDEGAATGLAVLFGVWAATGVVMLTSPAGSTSPALGILLCAAAGALLVPAAVTAFSKPLMTAVLVLIGARFALSGVYEFGDSSAVRTSAGALGVAVSCLAWYAAAAFAVEDGVGRTLLPTARARPFPPTPATEDPGIATAEAGVRARL
jgi:hypothetical protein